MEKRLLLFMIFVSCSSNITTVNKEQTEINQIEAKYKYFHKKNNKDATYTLYYKTEENQMSPVKWFTYFVVDNSNNKIIKEPKGIAAKDIYWKSENTIAIIPYKEVEKSKTLVGKGDNNEILIKIK